MGLIIINGELIHTSQVISTFTGKLPKGELPAIGIPIINTGKTVVLTQITTEEILAIRPPVYNDLLLLP